jgi:tripartite-type tricarboxylate transporter receptor subunit TctC
MERTMPLRLARAAAIAATAFTGPAAGGQSYPSHTITLVVPFPAGGPTDTIGRVLADGLQMALGQPVIIENVPGATGSIGTAKVARASADGYTLILGTVATHVFNGAAYELNYDVAKDFDPISLIAFDPQVIAVRTGFPATDLTQLIAWLRDNPDKATAGTAGVGSTSHISAVKFQKITGTQFGFVPYRGLGPAMRDLMSGHIDILFDLAANSIPQIKAGSINALAVTAPNRLSSAPEIPTVDEAGLTGFYFANWHAVWTPRGTPVEVNAKLNAAVRKTLADPAVAKRLADIGQQLPTPERQSAEILAAYQNDEIERWWPLIKGANIKAN